MAFVGHFTFRAIYIRLAQRDRLLLINIALIPSTYSVNLSTFLVRQKVNTHLPHALIPNFLLQAPYRHTYTYCICNYTISHHHKTKTKTKEKKKLPPHGIEPWTSSLLVMRSTTEL